MNRATERQSVTRSVKKFVENDTCDPLRVIISGIKIQKNGGWWWWTKLKCKNRFTGCTRSLLGATRARPCCTLAP